MHRLGAGEMKQPGLGSQPRGRGGRGGSTGALLLSSGLLLAAFLEQAVLLGGHGGDAFPADVYPPSVPARHEGFSIAAACPNPKGLERPEAVEVEELLRVVEEHAAAVRRGDLAAAKRTTDPAYWPILDQQEAVRPSASAEGQDGVEGAGEIGSSEIGIGEIGPAAQSPHADLIANNCGSGVMAATWWVAILPSGARTAADAPSLVSHLYLIRRQGRWLIWAID